MIDGHRLNDNIYDQAQIGTEFPLDIDLIERIEIVRGPGSSLYGTSAFFAVINIITRPDWQQPTAEAAGAYGSHDAANLRLTLGSGLPAGVTALISGSLYDSNGERNIYFNYDDPADNNGPAHNVDGDKSYSLFSRISWQDFTLQALLSKREKTVPTGAWGTLFNDSDNRSNDERRFLDLKYQRRVDPTLDILGRLTYDLYKYDQKYIYDESADGGPARAGYRDEVYGSWWGGELQATKTLLARHIVTIGGEWRDSLRQEQRYFAEQAQSPYLDDDRRSFAMGAYLQDNWKILDNLHLTIGVRYDYIDSGDDSLSPRAALVYAPWEKSAFKLLYGSAFRAPNVYELYYDDGGDTMKANPDLKPEKIKTWEGVYEQYLGEHLRSSVSGFYYRTDDLISLGEDPDSGLSMFQNIDKTEAYGGEAEIEGRWPSELAGKLSYSYQETKDLDSGRILSNSPRQLLKGSLTLPLAHKKLLGTVEILYTSARRNEPDSGRSGAGGFTITNLTLFSRNLLPGLELSASVYNLFDKSYADIAGSEHYTMSTLSQEGRTYRAKLSYRF